MIVLILLLIWFIFLLNSRRKDVTYSGLFFNTPLSVEKKKESPLKVTKKDILDIIDLLERETIMMAQRNAKDFLEGSEFEIVILNPKELKKVLEHRYPNKVSILNKSNIDNYNLYEMLFEKYKKEYDAILEKILPTLIDRLKFHAYILAKLDTNIEIKRNYYDFIISIMKKYYLVQTNHKLISVLERMYNDYEYRYICITTDLYNHYSKYFYEMYSHSQENQIYYQNFIINYYLGDNLETYIDINVAIQFEEITPYLKNKNMVVAKTKFLCKCNKLKDTYVLRENRMTKKVKELIIICDECYINNKYNTIKPLDYPLIVNN